MLCMYLVIRLIQVALRLFGGGDVSRYVHQTVHQSGGTAIHGGQVLVKELQLLLQE